MTAAKTGRLALCLGVIAGTVLMLGAREGGPPLDREARRWVERTLRAMTLEQKVGQLLVPAFDTTFISSDGEVFDRLSRLVRDRGVGGFAVFGQRSRPTPNVLLNEGYAAVTLANPFDAASLLNRLQALARVPLLNGTDVETGVAMRFEGPTAFPRAMAFGAAGDERLAFEAGRITAIEGRAMGLHVAFAPVADVNNNPRNPVINTRSFGEDPRRVAALSGAFARGLAAGGMVATLKHFPGHGDTDVDSHLGLPRLDHERTRLDAIELLPFQAGIAAGAGAVMVAHIELPALEPDPRLPATLSHAVVTKLLREELGFQGLVYTDAMIMRAMSTLMPPDEAAVRAVRAGNDLIMDSPDTELALNAIVAAVRAGTLDESRITASVVRVLEAKARLGLHRTRKADLDALPQVVGTRAHAAVADEVSRRSVTLIKDEWGNVPLAVPPTAHVLYLSILDDVRGWGIAAPSRTFRPAMQERWPNLTAIELSDRSTENELDLVRATAARVDAIVVSLFVRASSANGGRVLAPPLETFLRRLARDAAGQKPIVTVLFGNPYAAVELRDLPALLLTYDFYDRAEAAAVKAITGEAAVTGRLPVSLPGLFPAGHGLDRPALP